MIKPILSQSNSMSLDEVLTRLSRNRAVEGVLTLGSTRARELHEHSDYDLLVVLSQMPVPLRVISYHYRRTINRYSFCAHYPYF